jgi:hypothetical protein
MKAKAGNKLIPPKPVSRVQKEGENSMWSSDPGRYSIEIHFPVSPARLIQVTRASAERFMPFFVVGRRRAIDG